MGACWDKLVYKIVFVNMISDRCGTYIQVDIGGWCMAYIRKWAWGTYVVVTTSVHQTEEVTAESGTNVGFNFQTRTMHPSQPQYRISSKSRCTSKSHRPRNLAASICQLIPINAALEISPHGKGLTAISVCARAFYLHTNRFIIEAMYAHACQSL